MTRSLRGQLILGAAVGVAVLTLFYGGLLYRTVRADHFRQHDRALLKSARALTGLIEQEGNGLELEWLDADEGEEPVSPDSMPLYFQLRGPRGPIDASAAMKDQPEQWTAEAEPSWSDARLPDGAAARAVVMRFNPKRSLSDAQEGVADAALPPPITLELRVLEPIAPIEAAMGRLVESMLLAGLIALALGVLGSTLLVRRTTRPLAQLAERIESLDPGALEADVHVGRAPSEVAVVVEQLNSLLGRLGAAVEREQRFTADAAHELRTPLAGLRAKLEVALARERGADEHRAIAERCLSISSGMERVVGRLLSLARLEGEARKSEPIDVDLDAVVRQAWLPAAHLAEQRDASVEWSVAAEARPRLDRNALHLVLSNVFENAVSHVDEGGTIRIEAQAEAGGMRLIVANSGCELTPEQVARVFDPFWRGDRNGSDGHAGLGLAICRRAVQASGGTIEVAVEPPGYFRVEVALPAPGSQVPMAGKCESSSGSSA